MISRTRIGERSSNGLILSIQQFAAQHYHWDLTYINQVPMISILLLMRQFVATQDGNSGFTLMDQEAIESTSWDELVKKSRQQLSIKNLNI